MFLVITVILVALVFEYINGFHDTANSIATIVSTKVLTPRQAVIMAAITNLFGALWGTAVAKTISSGLVDATAVSMTSDVILCALIGAIVWNLVTWWFGLPSSSSHALIGGLCGSALAAAHNNWHVIVWAQPDKQHWWLGKGLWWKVIVPMVTSPLAGLILGFVFMALLYLLLHRRRPQRVNRFFGVAQIFSAASMGVMHGTNDAQKTMGIITLTLVVTTKAGLFAGLPVWLGWLNTPEGTPAGHLAPIPWLLSHLPQWLQFGYQPPTVDVKSQFIPVWVTVVCALTMCAGTAVGGWRIIRTLGHKMVKLHPINGFAAEASSATVIFMATQLGIPVSTTHNISAAIMGVGAAKRFNAIKWTVVERMVWAWVLTIPVTGAMAYGLVMLARALGVSI